MRQQYISHAFRSSSVSSSYQHQHHKKEEKGGSQNGFKKPLCFRLFVFSRISQLLHVLLASAKEAKSPDEKDMTSSHCMGSEDARGLL